MQNGVSKDASIYLSSIQRYQTSKEHSTWRHFSCFCYTVHSIAIVLVLSYTYVGYAFSCYKSGAVSTFFFNLRRKKFFNSSQVWHYTNVEYQYLIDILDLFIDLAVGTHSEGGTRENRSHVPPLWIVLIFFAEIL